MDYINPIGSHITNIGTNVGSIFYNVWGYINPSNYYKYIPTKDSNIQINPNDIIVKKDTDEKTIKLYQKNDDIDDISSVEQLLNFPFENENDLLKKYEYNEKNLLGKGSYGSVYKIKLKNSNPENFFVLKKINENKNDETHFYGLLNEIVILNKMKYHCDEYIICFKEIYKEKNDYFIIMEFAHGFVTIDYLKQGIQKLFNIKNNQNNVFSNFMGYFNNSNIEDKKKIETEINNEKIKIYIMISNICNAISKLHELGIVHRDIKLENILVKNDFSKIKIIDFGFSNLISNINKKNWSTPLYIYYNPPNPRDFNWEYLKSADIYAFGILFILCFFDCSIKENNKNISNGIIYDNDNTLKNRKIEYSKGDFPPEIKNVFNGFKNYVEMYNKKIDEEKINEEKLCYFELSDILSGNINRRKFINPKIYRILPPNWVEYFDKDSNNFYYYNSVTNVTQWEFPTELEPETQQESQRQEEVYPPLRPHEDKGTVFVPLEGKQTNTYWPFGGKYKKNKNKGKNTINKKRKNKNTLKKKIQRDITKKNKKKYQRNNKSKKNNYN